MTTIHFKTHSRWHRNLSLRWIRDKSCTMGHPESIKFGWAVGRRTQEEMKKLHQNFMIENSNSDKVSHHGYHRFYPWFLAHLQGQDINLLEIGIDRTESLKLWKGYFGKINLHGIDIATKVFYDKEVSLHRVDQSSDAELENFAKNIGINFDVILDDGSHVPDHQMLTINKLWNLVKPGGIYIIEDIETSYWKKSRIYGYRFNAKKNGIISNFCDLIDVINFEFSRKNTKNALINSFARDVEMVTFAQNCIILIKKDNQNFSQYYDRDYRLNTKINYRAIQNLPKRIFRKLRNFI